ncbi:MAG: S-layer homology domain-containing protein [Tissierellales bacterium]
MIRSKNKLFRAFISTLLAFLLLISSANIAVYAQIDTDEAQRVTNSFVQYSVSKKDGRFSIKTDEGIPYKDDDGKQLLFEENRPETSFTTFRIDGKDYIYGNNYGFLNLDGTFLVAPKVNGKQNISTWKLGNVNITQRLELIQDNDNPNVGNVRITYAVENKDKANKEIGTRILLDTMLGSNDGAPIIMAGSQEPITNEKRIVGNDVPQYWRSTDNLFMPTVISYGFTQGWGNISPNEMVVGHWNGLSETKWDYNIDGNLNFTQSDNKFGSADSAVALYWKPITIKPGETKVFETYYGIGNFQNLNDGAKFVLNINAPDKLVLNNDKNGYVDDTFEIIAEIDNTLEDASNLTNVTASLILEEGLTLTGGQIPYISTDVIERNGMHTFKWSVKADKSNNFTSKQFRVDISSDNSTEPISNGGHIILPGISGKPPEIQFHNITPRKVYFEGMKSFTIKGKGYDVYNNKNLWKMILINDLTKGSVQIPRDNISVKDDSITVNFDSNMDTGFYSIKIQHDDFDEETIPYKLEMTKDVKFKSRSYGVLYVKKAKEASEWKYSIETTESDESLKQIVDKLAYNEDIILTIKGDIRESEENGEKVYRAYSDAEQIVINSVIQYSGQPLEISKIDDTAKILGIDTISIEGDGKLTLENGFTFWWWGFEINITDEENYVTDFAEDDEANVEIEYVGMGSVVKWIAGFCIEIENAVVLKEGVSFGGNMQINFLPGSDKKDKKSKSDEEVSGADLRRLFGEEDYESDEDDDEDEDGGIKADISKVLFGKKDDGFGFIGIDTETEIKLSKDTIPISLIQDGFEATLTINTIEDIYGLEAEVNIKIVEAYVNLTFVKNQSTGNYLPDDLVLAGGYEPGVPVGPTGIFITKVGGGVEDLFGTLTGDSSLPPLQVILMTSIDFAKVIELDAKLSVSKDGFLLEGEGEIAKIKALEEVRVGVKWTRPVHLDLGAKLSLFEIIEGEISLFIGEEKWEGIVSASVSVPDDIWLVGGWELLNTELGANNKKIWGNVEIIRIPVGITYYWGKGVDFNIASADEDGFIFRNTGLYSTTLIDEDGDDMLMVVGSNIKRIASSNSSYYASLNPKFEQSLVIASLDNQEHVIDIQNQDIALLELKYSGERPNIHIYRPDGTEYPLINIENDPINANTRYQEIQRSVGVTEKLIYVSILSPESGWWKVVSDTPLTSSLMNVEPAPVLDNITVSQSSTNIFNVTWDADYDENTNVDIYLAKTKSEAGILLAEDLIGTSGQQSLEIPDGIEEGQYYIRVAIEKGDFGYDSMYSEDTVYVVDPYKPLGVTNIVAEPYGDGMIKVSWDRVNEEGVDECIITVYDIDDNVVQGIGHQIVSADKNSIILGGQYRIHGSEELVGLKPGEEYKVGIVASKNQGNEDKYTTHFSDTSYSSRVYLPKPDPAEINIEFDASFTNGYNNEGIITRISNKDKVTLYFSSDQSDITTRVYINGILYKTESEDMFELTIPTADGDYNVEFITVTKYGDTSTKAVNYTIDKTAPLLMIDSLQQRQVGDESEVLISGIGEKSASITINGMNVSTNGDGRFEKGIFLENILKQNIVIEAKDKANNVTRYETEVVNDTVKTIDRIYIRPVIEEILQGESQAFEAIVIDGNGREIVLNDGVEWSLIAGQALAEIDNEGKLNTFSSGQLILKVAYYISEDYSFEDAISINILPKIDNVIEDGGSDIDDPVEDPKEDPEENPVEDSRDDWYEHKPIYDDNQIAKELEKILENIIKKEQGIQLVEIIDISPNLSKTVFLGQSGQLTIPSNTIGQMDKLLVGIVNETSKYINEGNNKKTFQSPIYELQFAKSNDSFSKPVQLTFRYDEGKVKDVNNLAIYYYNEAFGKWQYLGGQINRSTREIKVNISHFSKYALIEDSTMPQFNDIKGRWSEDYIKGLYSLGVVTGIRDGSGYKYEPTRNITRVEFTKLVVETLLKTGKIKEISNDIDLPFVDKGQIPEWGKKYINLAYVNNIISGKTTESGNIIDSNSPITRAEATTIIGRTLGVLGDTNNGFLDNNQFPSWASKYIGALSNKKIIKGYPDNTFRPNNSITREEAASLILNWMH